MRKKQLAVSALLLAVCLALIPPASASGTDTTKSNTQADIEFTAGTGPTKPVDPDEPKDPHPEDPDPVEGSLAIVYVSNFTFGAVEVNSSGRYDVKTVKPNVQIVDLRGSGTGWKLNAALTQFTGTVNEQSVPNSLPGAKLHIANGTPNAVETIDPPTPQTGVELNVWDPDDPGFDENAYRPIVIANDGTGKGLWVNRFYPETGNTVYVQLEVPVSAAVKGSHRAEIRWTLEDTP